MFYANGTLKYDKKIIFYLSKEPLFWNWLSCVQIFEGPMSVCPLHWRWETLLSIILIIMNFGTSKLHFIRLKAWFYANGTIKYDKNFFFLFCKRAFTLNLALASSNFWKPQVRVPFSLACPNFIEWWIAFNAFMHP